MPNMLLDYYNNMRPSAFQCCKSGTTGIVAGLRMWLEPLKYQYSDKIEYGFPFPESDKRQAMSSCMGDCS